MGRAVSCRTDVGEVGIIDPGVRRHLRPAAGRGDGGVSILEAPYVAIAVRAVVRAALDDPDEDECAHDGKNEHDKREGSFHFVRHGSIIADGTPRHVTRPEAADAG